METNNREIVSLDEGLGSIIFSILRGKLDTVTVGLVESYDPDRQTISVQPAIMRLRENEDEAKPRPVIEDVRVIFPGSGDFWLTFPINQGDPVLLLAPSRSLDNWLDSGGVVDPGSGRIFDLSDAVAIPGILEDRSVIPNLKNDGTYLRSKATGGNPLSPTDPNSFIKVHDSGVDIGGDLNVDGEITATGDVVASSSAGTVSLLTHVHGGVTSGAASTATPTPVPIP